MVYIFFLVSVQILHAQPWNKIINSGNYKSACEWVSQNSWIRDSLISYGISPEDAIPIVFPELMRYSALEDKMEVTGLMVLYTRLGKDYADFSVGHFQMKPSFVQNLETDAKIYLSKDEIQRICPFLLDGKDNEDNRRKRVNSLSQVTNEVSYLALFYKICLKRFNQIHFKNEAEKIRFLATAYNCGYHHSAANLFQQMSKKQFPVYDGLLINHVNYASLALSWFNRNNTIADSSW